MSEVQIVAVALLSGLLGVAVVSDLRRHRIPNLLVLLGLVRPALKGGAERPRAIPMAGGTVDAMEAEQPERPALPAPTKKDELLPATPEQLRLEDARLLAKENPMAVANILKTWVNGEPV